MRDHKWLKQRLEIIWKNYFADVGLANNVYVKFGRASKTRLGSIKMSKPRRFLENFSKKDRSSIITVNGFFKDESIPECVVDAILAHELTHYAHGFASPHTQKHRHPHKNGVVKKELQDRGLEELQKKEKKWVKENWVNYLKERIKNG